jgi:hypothetical protein
MRLLIKSGEKETNEPQTSSNIRQPPTERFIVDLTTPVDITVDTLVHVKRKWILKALEATTE